MKTAKVKPAPGMVFRQPEQRYRPMPAEGDHVVLTPLYIRALREGDLVLQDEAPAEQRDHDDHAEG